MHTSHFKGEMGSWGTHLFCYCTFCFTLHLFSQWRHEQFWTSTARCKPSDIFKLLRLKACACSRFPTACDKLQSVIVLLTDIQSPCWIFMPYLVCRGLSSSCTYIVDTCQLFVHLFLLIQHAHFCWTRKRNLIRGRFGSNSSAARLCVLSTFNHVQQENISRIVAKWKSVQLQKEQRSTEMASIDFIENICAKGKRLFCEPQYFVFWIVALWHQRYSL